MINDFYHIILDEIFDTTKIIMKKLLEVGTRIISNGHPNLCLRIHDLTFITPESTTLDSIIHKSVQKKKHDPRLLENWY